MPGWRLHRMARRWFGTGTCEQVFEPLIADLQREWSDTAPAAQRSVALARGYVAFWHAVAACGIHAIRRGTLSPMAYDMAIPAMTAFLCAPLGVTALRLVGASRAYWQQPIGVFVLGEVSTLGWSIVFAMVPGFMYSRPQPHRAWNATTSRLLIAGVAISIVCVGWVGPALRGAHEHALGHFLNDRNQPAFESLPSLVQAVRHQSIPDAMIWRRALNGRFTMTVSALLLGLIGWQLSGFRRPSWRRALAAWFVLMELVLATEAYVPHGLWWQWLVPGLLITLLLTLRARAPRAQAG